MPIIVDKELYNKVKKNADEIYSKNSAYKSGYIVKKYKELGGKYKDDNKPKNLKRWFNEKWYDIANLDYPVYRPSIKIEKNTPLLVSEINKDNLIKQIKEKQKKKANEKLSGGMYLLYNTLKLQNTKLLKDVQEQFEENLPFECDLESDFIKPSYIVPKIISHKLERHLNKNTF